MGCPVLQAEPSCAARWCPDGLIWMLDAATSWGRYVKDRSPRSPLSCSASGCSAECCRSPVTRHGPHCFCTPCISSLKSQRCYGCLPSSLYEYLYAVALPSLVLKPALALFVAQLALREAKAIGETTARRETELRESVRPNEARLLLLTDELTRPRTALSKCLGTSPGSHFEVCSPETHLQPLRWRYEVTTKRASTIGRYSSQSMTRIVRRTWSSNVCGQALVLMIRCGSPLRP